MSMTFRIRIVSPTRVMKPKNQDESGKEIRSIHTSCLVLPGFNICLHEKYIHVDLVIGQEQTAALADALLHPTAGALNAHRRRLLGRTADVANFGHETDCNCK